MTIPRFAGFLFALAVVPGAHALQLGQAAPQSNRGEPLTARIDLFGNLDAHSREVRVDLLPDFGTSAERLALQGITATLRDDVDGSSYVALVGTVPFKDATLHFRLRISTPRLSLVRGYALDVPAPAPLPPAAKRRVRGTATRNATPLAPLPAAGTYGPVRPGQTLWNILVERGLARGDIATRMGEVVRLNPAAFVRGDANRLRVGAMLELPGNAGASAPQAAPPAPSEPVPVPVPRATALDDQTAARLARLAERYAAIRARYQQQQATAAMAVPMPDVAAPGPAIDDPEQAPNSSSASAGGPSARLVPAPPSTAAPAPRAPRSEEPGVAPEGLSWKMLALVVLVTLAAVAYAVKRRLPGRRLATAGDEGRSADQAKLAEIAHKTGKRLQMEDELRRNIGGRGLVGDAAQPLPRAASM